MMNMLLEQSFKRVASWLDMYPLNFPSSCLHFYECEEIIYCYSVILLSLVKI